MPAGRDGAPLSPPDCSQRHRSASMWGRVSFGRVSTVTPSWSAVTPPRRTTAPVSGWKPIKPASNAEWWFLHKMRPFRASSALLGHAPDMGGIQQWPHSDRANRATPAAAFPNFKSEFCGALHAPHHLGHFCTAGLQSELAGSHCLALGRSSAGCRQIQ
jgi:hypothetical protein